MEGSDPGLCVVAASGSPTDTLANFGRLASIRIVTQKEAIKAVNGFHLSGHGGTNDGIIGTCAGGGRTISGWSGRFIELKGLGSICGKGEGVAAIGQKSALVDGRTKV